MLYSTYSIALYMMQWQVPASNLSDVANRPLSDNSWLYFSGILYGIFSVRWEGKEDLPVLTTNSKRGQTNNLSLF